jgi:putative transposase
MSRTGYETDLTDAQWEIVAPFLYAKHSPDHWNRDYSLRQILNGVFYRLRTGCQWRNLPNDLPPWSTVHAYYRLWRRTGLLERLHAALREQVRRQAAKEAQPSAGSLDSQTVKSTEKGGALARSVTMGPKGSKVANGSSSSIH